TGIICVGRTSSFSRRSDSVLIVSKRAAISCGRSNWYRPHIASAPFRSLARQRARQLCATKEYTSRVGVTKRGKWLRRGEDVSADRDLSPRSFQLSLSSLPSIMPLVIAIARIDLVGAVPFEPHGAAAICTISAWRHAPRAPFLPFLRLLFIIAIGGHQTE